MKPLVLAVILAAAGAVATTVVASDVVSERPNQYPSPTVQTPADDPLFSADWPWQENRLTGDWLGMRGQLAEQGVVFDIQYVSAMMGNVAGGIDTGFVGGGPFGITATLDAERILGVEGGMLFVDWEFFRWYNGPFPNSGQFDPTGSGVGVNTNFIDGDAKELNQIAQLYYTQSLWDDQVSVTFGKLDGNVTFAAVDAAAGFQNSLAMYTSTLNPFMPTYPNEATALAASLQLTESIQGHLGWFDGTTAAFDPQTGLSGPATGPRGPQSFFDNDGNWFLVTQWDVTWQLDPRRPGSAGAGAWVQTGRTATSGTSTQGVVDVPGWYVQWQQTLWSPSEEIASDGGGITYFGQFGWSDPSKNPVHWSIMSGVSATGVVPCRPADALGLMFGYTRFTSNSSVYQSTQPGGLAGPSGGQEMSLEAFYIYQWNSWLYVQPGIMWIGDPGGGDPPPLDDALLGYLLVGVEF